MAFKKEILDEHMKKVIVRLQSDFSTIRTGRANVGRILG